MRLSYLFNLLAAVAVVGVLIFGSSDSRAAFRLMGASGAVSLSNSREGVAILNGTGLRPGTQSRGSVTIGNQGSSETRLALEVSSEGEAGGAGGARIWDTLQISISDGATVVYEGRVADLGRLALGALNGGGQRTYTMTAWVPSGANDNALQGAQLSLRFTWLTESTATATPAPPDPTRPPVSPPVTPERPGPRPAHRSRCCGHRRQAHLDAAGQAVRQPPHGDGQDQAAERREGEVRRDHRQRQEGRVGEGRQDHGHAPRPPEGHDQGHGHGHALHGPQAHPQAHLQDLRKVNPT